MTRKMPAAEHAALARQIGDARVADGCGFCGMDIQLDHTGCWVHSPGCDPRDVCSTPYGDHRRRGAT